ncbi:MAG: nucleoside-triphosphatase [Solirubrobacteraceae bacterium]
MKVLLEGRPGAGKTTVARRFWHLAREAGIAITGFVTEEIREEGRRTGFRLETTAGRRGVLAHVEFGGPPRVGRYGVDLGALERLAIPALEAQSAVTVVDELGKMELASEAFRSAVAGLFGRSDAVVVATVQSARHPFTDELKRRSDVDTLPVRAANRDQLPGQLVGRLVRLGGHRRG